MHSQGTIGRTKNNHESKNRLPDRLLSYRGALSEQLMTCDLTTQFVLPPTLLLLRLGSDTSRVRVRFPSQ